MNTKIKSLTRKEVHQIRRFLLTGLNGWEHPLEKDHEKQEEGWFPAYSTVRMAEEAMRNLLKLKADLAKFHAEKAEWYWIEQFPEKNQ